MALHCEIVRNKEINKWHARIVGGNNEIVFASQLYPSRESAKRACEDVKATSSWPEIKFVEVDSEDYKGRNFRRQLHPKRHR